jgi:hypothetical protein
MCELTEDEAANDEPVNDQSVAEIQSQNEKITAADVRAD